VALTVGQDQDRTLFGFDRPERTEDSGAVLMGLDAREGRGFPILGKFVARTTVVVGAGGGTLADGVDAGVAAELFGPELAQAHVHRHADHPGAELGAGVEAGEALDDFDEGILREIRRELAVADHADADGKEAVLIGGDERSPSVGLARANALDELQVIFLSDRLVGHGKG
jgi:hypothetical protein